eukprot:CAMPEP_0119298980 /NCGR_PEP_ID=MMETSP1333-20130426/1109_1 /TAXON_ID=418940 /ORGANISM="Scyphosphaera apsteinii, Strain RCC1455" /LENGTH=48 /DNA_ID= /DNA_START= /DNA_END= /DNA_ORIENTATION=
MAAAMTVTTAATTGSRVASKSCSVCPDNASARDDHRKIARPLEDSVAI